MDKSNQIIMNEDDVIFAEKSREAEVNALERKGITEHQEELILPDYLPEVHRLVKISAKATLPEQFVGGDAAEFSGQVIWSVLYSGENGCMNQATATSPYEYKVDFDIPGGVSFACDIVGVESVTGRVAAPRKVVLHAKLSHNVELKTYISTDAEIVGDDGEENIKKLEKTVLSEQKIRAFDGDLNAEDLFQVDDTARIAGVTATAVINSATYDGSDAVCRGNVEITLLVCDEENKPTFITHQIPIETAIPTNADGDGWQCRAAASVNDVVTDTTESGISVLAKLSIEVELCRNKPVTYIADIYSTDRETEVETKKLDLPYADVCKNFSFTHDAVTMFDGLPENATILYVTALPSCDDIILEKGKYVFLGNCRYGVLFGSSEEYSFRESVLPLRFELCDGNESPDNFSVNVKAYACRARLDRDTVTFGSEIAISAYIAGKTVVNAVSKATFGEPIDDGKKNCFTVAFVSDGDTLWSIAKRYSSDSSALASQNGIKPLPVDSATSLKGVDYLII